MLHTLKLPAKPYCSSSYRTMSQDFSRKAPLPYLPKAQNRSKTSPTEHLSQERSTLGYGKRTPATSENEGSLTSHMSDVRTTSPIS